MFSQPLCRAACPLYLRCFSNYGLVQSLGFYGGRFCIRPFGPFADRNYLTPPFGGSRHHPAKAGILVMFQGFYLLRKLENALLPHAKKTKLSLNWVYKQAYNSGKRADGGAGGMTYCDKREKGATSPGFVSS